MKFHTAVERMLQGQVLGTSDTEPCQQSLNMPFPTEGGNDTVESSCKLLLKDYDVSLY